MPNLYRGGIIQFLDSVWVADWTPPSSGWHESKNWIIPCLSIYRCHNMTNWYNVHWIAGMRRSTGKPSYHNWLKQEKELKQSRMIKQQQEEGHSQGQTQDADSPSLMPHTDSQGEEENSSITNKHSENSIQNAEGDSAKSNDKHSEKASALTAKTHPEPLGLPGLAAWPTSEQFQGSHFPLFPTMQGQFYYWNWIFPCTCHFIQQDTVYYNMTDFL